jgi:hypothetical protein
MKVEIKVLNIPGTGAQRVFLSQIYDAHTSKEVLAEVFRGRQAVGNNYMTMIRCGADKDFYGVTTKSEITNWIDKRLKEDRQG